MRFKKILFKITKNEINELYIFTPRNLKLIPKTIFKIIISLKKEIKNTRFILNSVSHDLKTPLTKAKLLIEKGDANNPMIINYFNDIEYLFSQITIYYRRDNCKEKFSKIDIVSFTECLYDDYNILNYPITFSSAIKNGLVYIQNTAVKRAFVNIIENALKYAGSVNISITEYNEKFIQVSFTDEGPGISESDLKKIFTPFFRSDIARNSMVPGTGLGLTIVKKILDINHAKIDIRNKKPNGLKASISFIRLKTNP
ncbi:histidine kinase-, DNA gyrase B-, and HSP90-like ATPase family protein [Francisella philomiragia]|nr:histidine kinase-, DNA gyrase B-, and HSP90-like ATPase family protein [Francisella philomiragia]